MKKGLMFVFSAILVLSLFLSTGVSAQEDTNKSEFDFNEVKDKAGTIPGQAFYFLDRAFDTFQSSESLADERAYELAVLADKSAEGEEIDNETMEKARQRYGKTMRKVNRKANRSGDVSERVANATTKHLEALSMVYDKVPEQAKGAIEKAMNRSMKGREKAIDSLSQFNQTKAEKMKEQTNETIRNRVPEEVRQRIHMRGLEQAHIRAMRMNVECGLFPEEFNVSDLPQELRNRTEKIRIEREELLEMIRGLAIEETEEIQKQIQTQNMSQEQIMQKVQKKIKKNLELAKDTAETLNEKYGRGMGYWKTHFGCPREEEGKEGEKEKEKDFEIEFEIEDGTAKVEMKINETENEFTLNTTNKSEIVLEIMNRTGLSKNQIRKYLEFEKEKEDTSCEVTEDCEGLHHIAVPGEWKCVNHQCVWKTDKGKEGKENDFEEKCANYTRYGEIETHCATCGDGICEDYERCSASTISETEEGQLIKTDDCGGLYCPEDCEVEGEECAEEGEKFSKVYTKEYPEECCEGLTEWYSGMDTRISIGNECYDTNKLSGNPVGTCIKANDGVCSDLENPCNSPEDCSEGQNSDYDSVEEFCNKEYSSYCDDVPETEDLELCSLC